jgi:hypothetical protein
MLFLLSTLACGDRAGKLEAARFEGTWQDEGGGITVIELQGREPVVAFVQDYDDEVFEVVSSDYEAGRMTWVYVVPSTQYQVTVETTSLEDGLLCTTWLNQYDSGSECYIRLE